MLTDAIELSSCAIGVENDAKMTNWEKKASNDKKTCNTKI